MNDKQISMLAEKLKEKKYIPYNVVRIQCLEEGTDCSEYITEIVNNAEDHTIFSFDTGRYLIKTFALIKGKKDIILEGNNSIFLQYYDSHDYGKNCSDIFHIEDCRDIVIRNLSVEAFSPTQISGTVVNIADDYMDVKITDRIPFTGNEHGSVGYSHSPKTNCTHSIARSSSKVEPYYAFIGGEIPTTNPLPPSIECEKIGENILRLKSLYNQHNGNPYPENNDFELGTPFALRYIYYGPVAFVFRNTDTALIEDVCISDFGGMGFVILPRCSNFTFNRLQIVPKDPDINYYSTTADGIHTTGLSGKLIIKDSVFRNLGDDSLNAHTQVLKAKKVGSGEIEIYYDMKKPYISPYWAAPGDVLHIFDANTYERKKDIVVKDFKDNIITVDENHGVQEDDFIINDTFRPEILVENCVSYNMRGRAFISCGAKSMTVKNCEFYSTNGCAMYITTAFNGWLEGAQVENVEFCNNYVVGCDVWSDEDATVISAKVRTAAIGFVSNDNMPTMHSNVHIHDNVFENINGQIVGIDYTDGVKVENNVFANCITEKEKIQFFGCKNCEVKNNTDI